MNQPQLDHVRELSAECQTISNVLRDQPHRDDAPHLRLRLAALSQSMALHARRFAEVCR